MDFGSGNLAGAQKKSRSEEHTSELQSRLHLVCRLLLAKKNVTAALPNSKAERQAALRVPALTTEEQYHGIGYAFAARAFPTQGPPVVLLCSACDSPPSG